MTQQASIMAIPDGLPHRSKIFARGSFASPPMMLDIIVDAAVSECKANALVTNGFRARRTTSLVDVTKYMSHMLRYDFVSAWFTIVAK